MRKSHCLERSPASRLFNRGNRIRVTINWKEQPDDYDSITFHADDLHDAEWKVDFSYTVLEGLRSGVYAAQLKRDGDSDQSAEYIVFFVAAPKGHPRAKLALGCLTTTTSLTTRSR
jgi:hypothetical protein